MSRSDQISVTVPEQRAALDDQVLPPAPPAPSRVRRLLQAEIGSKKVPRKDLMHFSRQLAVFVKAGIPILDALETIHEEMGNKTFRAVVESMTEALRAGATFADAAAEHSEAFPAYYVGILRSAEMTGRLDTVLNQLAEYIERDLDARRKVTSALTYPAVIFVMSIVVVVVLVLVVLPKFEVFFADLGAKLPLPTRMLLAMSDLLTDWWYVFAGGFASVAVALVVTLRTEGGKALKDRVLLRLPVLGDLMRHVVLERFCRILSSMMQAGVPLPDAMSVTAEATSNSVYRKGLDVARESMLRGEGLAGPLNESGLFPPSARQMFRVGESTGTLDEQLVTAAEYFERELDYKIKRFTALFEPIVIVGMGLVVGFVAVALVSAMYGIFQNTAI